MLFSAHSSRKNKSTPYTDDNELISVSSPKRERMEVSTPANGTPCIRIEQLVKHDVWDISKKNDGAFVMKKLTGNENGASANTGTARITAVANAEQTGARPKIITEVPQTHTMTVNAGNRLQNVNSGNTVNTKPVNAPRMEVIMPQKSVITLTPTNTQKNSVITINTRPAPTTGITTMKTTPPENGVIILNAAATAPKKDVITINPTPKQEVVTISETPSPKKEVITISAIPFIRPAVLTINTNTKKDEEPGSQSKGDVNMRKTTKYNIWEGTGKGSSDSVASAINSGPSVSGGMSDRGVPSPSIPFYSDEVYQIQEMFPQVPLNVIADELRNSGSVESAIDSLLAQAVEEPVPSNEVPPATSSDDDVVFLKSVKPDKPKADSVPGGKKGGAVIKIELLTRNEVWDIKMKEKEGFVLKKTEEGVETEVTDTFKAESQYSKPDSDLRADDSVEVIEEEDPLLDEMLLGNRSPVGNPAQSNGPVKLMVYSQSSDNNSPVSKRKVARPSAEENLDPTMEVDSFDDSYLRPQENVSVEAFEFSDDENEECETIEHFLFKASLVLKKLKHRNETGMPNDSALLNITGSTKSKDDSVPAEEGDVDDSEEYYTDECYTDEGD